MNNRLTFISTGRADFAAHAEILRLASQGAEETLVLCADEEDLQGQLASEEISCRTVSFGIDPHADTALGGCVRSATLLSKVAAELNDHRPDCLVLAGDRFELMPILAVAILLRIPIAHISGGESTEGAMDEQVRHAVTKAAHVHFVANDVFGRRLRQMGEETWRIHVTGDPALDRIRRADISSRSDLAGLAGLPVDDNLLLVAYHPVTNAPQDTWREWEAISEALESYSGTIIATGSNSDPDGRQLTDRISKWCEGDARRRFINHLGQAKFLGLLRAGACLVGNSSAAIWEAPSLGAPAVNIGCRQSGRLRGGNVIDVPVADAAAIRAAIQMAREPAWRGRARDGGSPYGDGQSAPRIRSILASLPSANALLMKHFVDQNISYDADALNAART